MSKTHEIAKLKQEVSDFFEAQKIPSIYPNRAQEIENNLIKRWDKLDESLRSQEKKELANILQLREEGVRTYNKLIRKEIEVRKCDLGQINDELFDARFDKEYREKLFDDRVFAKNSVIEHDENFFNLANKGRKAYKNEITSAQKQNILKKPGLFADNSYTSLHPLSLGRGMIYNSEVSKDERYHRYLKTRSALLDQLREKLGIKNHKIKELIDNFESICANETSFNEEDLVFCQKQLIDEIAKLEKLNAEELKAVHGEVDKLNSATKDQLQKYLAEEDAAWPYVALQIALLVTPLAGFSFLPMIGEIIGPMFDEDLTFGKSVGAVIANIPGFGPLFHLMKIDYAIGWLLDNCPLVDGVTKILHETTNNIFTDTAFDLVAPTLACEIGGIALAGAYFGSVLDPKINTRDEKGNFVENKYDAHNEFVKNQKSSMEQTLEDFKKNGIDINNKNSKTTQEEALKNAADNMVSTANLKQLQTVSEKIKNLQKSKPEHLKELLADIKIDEKSLATSFFEDKEQAIKLLIKNPKIVNEVAENFIAYEEFYKNDIKAFKTNKDNIPTIIKKNYEHMMDKMGATLSQKADLANFIYCNDKQSLQKIFEGIEIEQKMPDGRNTKKTIADLKDDYNPSKPSQILSLLNEVDKKNIKELVKKMDENLTPNPSVKISSDIKKSSSVTVCR